MKSIYKKVFLFSIIFSLVGLVSLGQTGVIIGSVKDKKAQTPIEGVTIMLEGTGFGALSDSNGHFKITDVPDKAYNVKAQAIGYEPMVVYNVNVQSGNMQHVDIELEPAASTQLKELVVRRNPFQHKAETPLSIQSMSAQEMKSNPGGNFDVSRVIQAFPGVGGTSGSVGGYRNDLVIRGGAPNENVYYLDGIEVPVINHFATQGSAGGPTGIINIAFVQDLDLYTSAFPAKFDNVLSGALQMRQRDANPDKIEHNLRLSATDAAYYADGPISKNVSFEASMRRSYLQFLFAALKLPIQPAYWDFQYKINWKISKKLSFYSLGLGAIDKFNFLVPDNMTAENVYILQSNPFIDQWSYTNGYGLKKLIKKGYWNLTFSRNMLNNELNKYLDNQHPSDATQTLKLRSTEAENKLRMEVNQSSGNWSYSYGAMVQLDEFSNKLFDQVRTAVYDSMGHLVSPAININSTGKFSFLRYGAFGQVSRTFLDRKLTISAGLRTDGNTFTTNGNDVSKQVSPRIAASYSISRQLKWNTSVGRYYKIPTYTILGYTDSTKNYQNKDAKYTQSDHLVTGLELLPNWQGGRFTLEGFYKMYSNYAVSKLDGISLANKGGDFNTLGNEPVSFTGKGRSYGVEFQFQQKLTSNFYTILSYTFYKSEFTNADGSYHPASWDNTHLLSFIGGYKFKHNIELGVKFRFQGGAPYTPFDMTASQQNYLTLGTGLFDYSKFNTLRLGAFNSMDLRLDKTWNFKKRTMDLFLDITNLYAAVQPAIPSYTFKRTPDNKAFATTDGAPIKADGSNAIPLILSNASGTVIPSIGFIFAF